MKSTFILTVIMTAMVALGTASCSKEADTESGQQTTCPVMKGEKINPQMYVDVQGKRIYVCCPGCITKIKAEPDKYIQQMEAEGIVLDKTPKQDDHSGHQH